MSTQRKFWFSRSAFSAIGEYVALGEDPRLADVTGPRLPVLLAMCSFVGLGDGSRADPQCFASLEAIAERAGVGKRTVRDALPRLCAAGLIEHTGRRVTGRDGRAGPVIYRLLVLVDVFAAQDARVAGAATLNEGGARRVAGAATEERAGAATEGRAGAATDPRNPGDPKGAEDEEDAANAAPLPGGRGSADAAGTSSSAIAEIAHEDGCSIEHAQVWAEWVLRGRKVDNPDLYLWGWQKKGNGPKNWTPPKPRTRQPVAENGPATPATTKRSSAKAAKKTQENGRGPAAKKGAAKKPRASNSRERQWEGAQRLRAGESAAALAEEYRVTPGTVKQWARDAERDESSIVARATVRQESRERIAERWPRAQVDYVLDTPEVLDRVRAKQEADRAEEERLLQHRERVQARQRAQADQEARQRAQAAPTPARPAPAPAPARPAAPTPARPAPAPARPAPAPARPAPVAERNGHAAPVPFSVELRRRAEHKRAERERAARAESNRREHAAWLREEAARHGHTVATGTDGAAPRPADPF